MQQLNCIDAAQILVDGGNKVDGTHNHKWKPSCQGHQAYNERRDGEAVVTLTVPFLVKISRDHFHFAQKD